MKDLFGDEPYHQHNPDPTGPARKARDKGIKRVVKNNNTWHAKALAHIQNLPIGWVGTGEDMRKHIQPLIEPPKHPNAWGGLARSALGSGRFQHTGNWIVPKDTPSHARPIREYRKIA